jgi:hypothetical protein
LGGLPVEIGDEVEVGGRVLGHRRHGTCQLPYRQRPSVVSADPDLASVGAQDTVDGAQEAELATIDVPARCAGRRLSLARRFRRSVEVLVQEGVDELHSEGVCVLRGVGGRLAEPQDRLRVALGLIEPHAKPAESSSAQPDDSLMRTCALRACIEIEK